jgi:hypothetical protein
MDGDSKKILAGLIIIIALVVTSTMYVYENYNNASKSTMSLKDMGYNDGINDVDPDNYINGNLTDASNEEQQKGAKEYFSGWKAGHDVYLQKCMNTNLIPLAQAKEESKLAEIYRTCHDKGYDDGYHNVPCEAFISNCSSQFKGYDEKVEAMMSGYVDGWSRGYKDKEIKEVNEERQEIMNRTRVAKS